MRHHSVKKQLQFISKQLGIDATIPFELTLPCGIVNAEALFRGLIGEVGVLLMFERDAQGELINQLQNFGYAYYLLNGKVDWENMHIEGWKAIIRTWDWTGNEPPPEWY